ncbi:MAG: HAMP domain-containing sensor histidine kinase [Pseudohongiella sp.]|nr:HAMP domain-containing sensor histidine kinase [Pseudohongiella sp.]
MNETSDYKAAYLRQKAARERVEGLLELRSRELYEANIVLQHQAKELDIENRANKQLIDRLSRVASQTSNGVVITGVDGNVQWVNDSFSTLMRGDPASFSNLPLLEVLLRSEPDLRVISSVESALTEFKPFSAEVFIGDQQGQSRWARIIGNPMLDSLGELQGFMAILVDITQIKEAERMKQEFTAAVSHELRTPLTSIMGAVDVINAGVFGPMPKAMEKLLSAASRNCKRLLELIDDLLDMDKLAAGKLSLKIESYALLPLLEQSIAAIQSYADKYNIHVELAAIAPDVRLLCDSRRFEQVMANLLSNAIKFSPHGSPVRVAVLVQSNKIRIEVTDSGPGIASEFRDRVFEYFTQADSSDKRSKGGTGLGLAITRKLVLQMNGDIGFETVVGSGTTFWLEWLTE